MNIHQIKKRQRFALVNQVLTENKTIVATVPAFAKAAKGFADSLAELQRLAQRQVIGSQGKTLAKEACRAELTDAVMEVSSRIGAYAEATGNVELEANASVTRSALLYRRAADGVLIASRVLSLARENQEAMETEYDMADLIDDLAEKTDAFQLVLEAPAKAIDNRAVTTAGIEQALATSAQILTKRLNRHVESLRRKHADFAAAYDQANAIEKRRRTRAKVEAEASVSEEVVLASKAIAVEASVEISTPHESQTRYSTNGNGGKEAEILELAR